MSAALENPMRHFTFSPEVLAAIRHDRYHHAHPRVQQKMEVLWLKSQGCTHEDIARLAAVSRRSVQRYLDEFAEGAWNGFDACPGRARPTNSLLTKPPWKTTSWKTRRARPARPKRSSSNKRASAAA
jgi:hypothetical protein